ncbi:class I SAM-dependent methyltransferase [Paraburkholderia caballeronis]|uniref:class I SAM-dependent methyltransferase n=1 Tax=Paraburkholderia caballeronis TaxID=416943 RepID=UPI0010647AAD|nr:SAM-dependent methyltransferase [Paraburkholderia caballeronis]TDV08111.1 SAM-dependent MidA family methyltransferase [Paraburkholderia caballeronis]TDV11825.1 SAM-dependent MidA family methyltransferase [Paraburkholderia caballeronis]TDV18105.1 SAM-dependent MidA family methyltransferase [Paraburkholderia caballeronis]
MNPKAHEPASLPVPGPTALAQSEALAATLRAEIASAGGWLPFDRYMERVLYAPGLGYYSGGAQKFGWRGDDGSDFVTAPELSPLFAATLARAVGDALAASDTRHLMEFGAGTGKLAAGLLAALDAAGAPVESYSIVELSGELRERQRETIEAHAPALAARVRWLDALPDRFEGVVVGNEVLDAMPVRLFARRDAVWHERGVAVTDAGGFAFSDRALNTAHDAAWSGSVLAAIEGGDDYVTETHDAALAFTRTVCAMLARGVAIFIDYGFPRHEFYHAQRAQGTLMCHYRHRAHGDPFLYPGLQDITSHVEFTGIAEAGVEAGAELLGYTSQARFLMNAGITDVLAELDPRDPERFLPAANAVQKLVSEAEMGELFKVIAFARGFDAASAPLAAFARGDRSHTL